MKKGFTLIELLAVIVILAIILVIAIPNIMKTMEQAKIDAYIKNEKMLAKVAQRYLAENTSLAPLNIGDTIEVKVSDLQNANIIDQIKDPRDNSNTCDGYVLVTKIEDNEYDYTPHIDCINDIGSISEDGLVGYWKFDDFQEWTQNLDADPLFANGTTTNSADSNKWYNSYYQYTITLTTNNGVLYHLGEQPGTQDVRINSTLLTLDKTKDYTVHFKVKYLQQETGNDNVYIQGPIVDNLQYSQLRLDTNYLTKKEALSDGFEYREYYLPANLMQGSGNTGRIGLWQAWNQIGTVEYYFKEFQIEQKAHATPFTEGIREDIVKDYSGNSNTGTLNASTPKWIKDSKVGNGAYEFNGTSNYIEVGYSPELQLNNIITVAAWVKPTNIVGYNTIVASGASTNETMFWMDIRESNKLYFGGYTSTGTPAYIGSTYSFVNDNWYFVVGVCDGTNFKTYVNGVQIGTAPATARISGEWPVKIGIRTGTVNYFKGNIDDLKIYNRALTKDEIKYLYDISK